jgi:hypothetical protein
MEIGLIILFSLFVLGVIISTRDWFILIVILLFWDFVAIKLKVEFGFSSIGVTKDLLLVLVVIYLLFSQRLGRRIVAQQISLMIVLFVFLLYSTEYRIFVNILTACVAGWLFGISGFRVSATILLSVVSAVWCVHQFEVVSDLSQLWFYDFLLAKKGDDFLLSLYGYVRNDFLRPPGFMVSPSIMGVAMIFLNYFGDRCLTNRYAKVTNKLLCFVTLIIIQTRALLIAFVFYELIRFIGVKNKLLIFLGFSLLTSITLVGTALYGDDGAIVRLLLLEGLLTDLQNGSALIPAISDMGVASDSQLVSFIRAFGVLGILIGIFSTRIILFHSTPTMVGANLEVIMFAVLVFISIFQWSGDSGGFLAAFALVFYFCGLTIYMRKNSCRLGSASDFTALKPKDGKCKLAGKRSFVKYSNDGRGF